MRKKFEALFAPEFNTTGIVPAGRWEKIGKLHLEHVAAQHGWLSLAWLQVENASARLPARAGELTGRSKLVLGSLSRPRRPSRRQEFLWPPLGGNSVRLPAAAKRHPLGSASRRVPETARFLRPAPSGPPEARCPQCLLSAQCPMHLSPDQPSGRRDARVPVRGRRADRCRRSPHEGQRSGGRTGARNVSLARRNRSSIGFANPSSTPSAWNSTATSKPATWKRRVSGSPNCRPRAITWTASWACICDSTARCPTPGQRKAGRCQTHPPVLPVRLLTRGGD